MRTYKERLPEIDKAIFERGGEWPPYVGDTSDFSRPFLMVSTDNHSRGSGIYSCSNFGAEHDNVAWVRICTRAEFEARVADWRRLYEWRKIKYPSICSFAEWLNMARDKAELSGALITKGKAERDSFNWQLSLEESQ